jgi:ER lumen protein retaining receptor
VFITRYLDIFTSFISVYNTVMKTFFLVSSMGTVYLMYMKFKATYDHNHDTFRYVSVSEASPDKYCVLKSTGPYTTIVKHSKTLTYRIEFLLGPAVLLALFLNHEFSVMEVLWTFSIYLESVAILPQLFMVSKTGEAESITSHYLFALGSYRALYIVNWVYRYYAESKCTYTTGLP